MTDDADDPEAPGSGSPTWPSGDEPPPPPPPPAAGPPEPPPSSASSSRTRGRVALALLFVAALAGLVVLGDDPLGGDVRRVQLTAPAGAGCEEAPVGDISNRDHLDPATAPPASELYDQPLPAGGRHYGTPSPLVLELPASALDPRAVLHNMEHGAVVVWVDADRVDAATLADVERWRQQLGVAGFDNRDTGAGIFVSPMPDGVEVDAPVALRAWGVALDCPTWNVAAADSFLAQHFGSRGEAPEAELGPYPDDNGVIVGPPGEREGDSTTV